MPKSRSLAVGSKYAKPKVAPPAPTGEPNPSHMQALTHLLPMVPGPNASAPAQIVIILSVSVSVGKYVCTDTKNWNNDTMIIVIERYVFTNIFSSVARPFLPEPWSSPLTLAWGWGGERTIVDRADE